MHSLDFRTWTQLAESSLRFPEMKIETLFFSHDLWSPWEQVGELRLAFVTTQAHSLQMLHVRVPWYRSPGSHRGGCGSGDPGYPDLVCTHRRSVGSRQRLRASGDSWRMTEDSCST